MMMSDNMQKTSTPFANIEDNLAFYEQQTCQTFHWRVPVDTPMSDFAWYNQQLSFQT